MTRRMSLLGPSMPLQKVLDVVESHLQARPDMQCSMAGQDSVWKLDAKKMLQVQSSRCTRMAAHDGLKVFRTASSCTDSMSWFRTHTSLM